jgi:hypothetical protein
MNRFWKWLVFLFLLAVPCWYGPVIYNDVTHPELWNDWMHNPRWYGPALLLVALAQVAVVLSAIRWKHRWERMTPEQRYEESLRLLKRRRR